MGRALATASWEQNRLSVQLEGILEGDIPREKAVLVTLHHKMSALKGSAWSGSLGNWQASGVGRDLVVQ